MANEQNLQPGKYKFTLEDVKKGQRNSAQARRERRDLRKALEALLEAKYPDKKTGKKITGTDAIAAKLFEQALKGNIRAFETIRATVGQDPVQKVMVAEVDQQTVDEVERMVMEDPEI